MALTKCPECGKDVSTEAASCPSCGHPMKQTALGGMSRDNKILLAVLAGLVLGGLAGFLARPNVPLVGQPPLEIVITAGSTLKGMDQMLVPFAKRSQFYLMLGAIGGAVLGVVVGDLLAPASGVVRRKGG